MQTQDLARLSNGIITAIDIYEPFLNSLKYQAEKGGLKDKIKTINMSLSDMNFKPESFDIIWSEGFIFIIGFEKVLIFGHPFLKENGSLAVSELS